VPSSAPLRSAASGLLPLAAHAGAGSIAAYRRGEPVSAGQFLHDVVRVADALPPAGHILNFCADRYWFAVVLCAAVRRGQVTLLPPTTTPNVIRAMREFAGDAYFVSDDPAMRVDLPRFELPRPSRGSREPADVERVSADHVAACVFTSGSTGEPAPHDKTWGGLVRDVRGAASRLRIGAGHAILGTVPPQHMYGLESTVMLPLATGAALTAERLYFPADIDAALARVPAPRVLITTPFHLKTWIEGGGAARVEMIVSATAPLSVALARAAEERTGAVLHEIYGCTEAGQVATRRPTASAEWEALEGLRLSTEGDRTSVVGGHVEQPTPLQDVIEVRPDGRHFLLHGRSADMVNIAGKRNSLGYLDHQLTSIPGVTDGAFFVPDEVQPDGVTRLTAFAVAPGLTAADITAALRELIDAAFMPRPLYLVEALPRQLTGKLPRAALEKLARQSRERRRADAK
jgi:acyl-coenzyme A synthetase/AMP-(fatty) acid ligase